MVRGLKRFDKMNKTIKEIVETFNIPKHVYLKPQNPKGAGRKNKYKEKTCTIAFRCPESKKEEVTNMIKDKLKEWEV